MKYIKSAILVLMTAAVCLIATSCLFKDKFYEVAIVTGSPGVTNRSTAQGVFTGIEEYCTENSKTYKEYIAAEDTEEAYLAQAAKAVEGGARIIAIAGLRVDGVADKIVALYPEIDFLLVDTAISKMNTRVHAVSFREEQAGFLAGCAAVFEGYTELGYMCSIENPISQRYFNGFVQGAEYAATAGGITEVSIRYWCAGTHNGSDDITAAATGWFSDGTDVIMAYGDGIQKSITTAANTMKAHTIGCDMDQAGRSERYITSATKSLEKATFDVLTSYFENDGWNDEKAGSTEALGITTDMIGLPTGLGSFRFAKWTVYQYETVYAGVKSGRIAVSQSSARPVTTVCVVTSFPTGTIPKPVAEGSSAAEEIISQ